MSREFFASRFSNPEDRLDLLEEWASEYSGRQPVDLIAGQQALADTALSFSSGSSGGGSGGTLNGDVVGVLTANTTKKLNNIPLTGTPSTGDVYSYTGTAWNSQQFTVGKWGVGPATPGVSRFEIDDNQLTAWFNGVSDSAALGSRGWHISKDRTLAHSSTFAWHSDGAPVWELGMASDTNNALNFGFGAADFLVFDATGNANAGSVIARVSVEEPSTNGTASKWAFGKGVTTPRASTAFFEIQNPVATMTGLRVKGAASQSGNTVEFQTSGGVNFFTAGPADVAATGNVAVTGNLNCGSFNAGGTVGAASGQAWRWNSATVTPSADLDYTLTNAEMATYLLTIVAGAWTTGRNIIVPNGAGGSWEISNSTGFALTVKTAAGTGISIANARSAGIRSNGVNCRRRWADVDPTV